MKSAIVKHAVIVPEIPLFQKTCAETSGSESAVPIQRVTGQVVTVTVAGQAVITTNLPSTMGECAVGRASRSFTVQSEYSYTNTSRHPVKGVL